MKGAFCIFGGLEDCCFSRHRVCEKVAVERSAKKFSDSLDFCFVTTLGRFKLCNGTLTYTKLTNGHLSSSKLNNCYRSNGRVAFRTRPASRPTLLRMPQVTWAGKRRHIAVHNGNGSESASAQEY